MTIERAIIVHGYTASPKDHWFEWLRGELADAGVEVSIPPLPDSSEPVLGTWVAEATAAIGAFDERTVVIGHSLGVITALHALGEARGDWRLGGFVGVSGFAEPLPNLPELDPFVETPPELRAIASRIGRRATFVSDNDEVVAPAATRRLAEVLDAPVSLVPGAGHFLGREGRTEFPELATLLRSWKQGANERLSETARDLCV